MYMLAQLKPDELEAVQEFERQANVRILALRDLDIDAAAIDSALLDKIKHLEEKLGLCLVAVR
jgi:hypothetical protein